MIVPRLLLFLQVQNAQIQHEALWVLTNIASGSDSYTNFIVISGAVPLLIPLLHSPDKDVKVQAIWCLSNICGDAVHKPILLQNNILRILSQMLERDNDVEVLSKSMWVLSNLCRGPGVPALEVVVEILNILKKYITCEEEEVLLDLCWALSYISGHGDQYQQAVIDADIVPEAIELMSDARKTIQVPALRFIGNFTFGDDIKTQYILDKGALHHFGSLIKSPSSKLQKEACWALSNSSLLFLSFFEFHSYKKNFFV